MTKLDFIIMVLHQQIKNLRMERTETWEKQNQIEIDANSIDMEQQQSNKIRDNKKQIIPEPASEHIAQEIQDDLTALRNKNNQSPLVFYGRIGPIFVFSFNKSQIKCFMVRFAIFTLFLIGVQVFVQYTAKVSRQIKIGLVILASIQVLSFLLLFYLDPGTLFEDQPEKLNQQRLYCQHCRVYKNYKSFHCKQCLKCVKGYDHHCGFFGKCIGRRNYLLYCLFLFVSGLGGTGCIGCLIFTLFQGVVNKWK